MSRQTLVVAALLSAGVVGAEALPGGSTASIWTAPPIGTLPDWWAHGNPGAPPPSAAPGYPREFWILLEGYQEFGRHADLLFEQWLAINGVTGFDMIKFSAFYRRWTALQG